MKTRNESNVDALIQIAFGDDEAASTAAIRKLFLKGKVKNAVKPKWTPSPEQVRALADRKRLDELRKADPRTWWRFWSGMRRTVAEALVEQEQRRLRALDDGTMRHAITVEDAVEGVT